ncbi:MAG: hypothetical protein O2860_07365, partial [Chloroflexi bacterium]|nr:hypothetical protein [Chloroflexota bacterium]
MLEYVRKCKGSYDKDGTACDYVRCVLREAELAARCEHVVKKGTKAIVKLRWTPLLGQRKGQVKIVSRWKV